MLTSGITHVTILGMGNNHHQRDIVFTVAVYKRSDGKNPTRDALQEFERISPDLRVAMQQAIVRAQRQSNHASGLTVHITAGLWCIQIVQRGYTARLFFTFTKGAQLYLLNGCAVKTTEDTIPNHHLKLAKQLAKEAKAYAQ